MKMKIAKAVATAALAVAAVASLAGCGGSSSITVAVPSDPTNEARALLLLEDQGFIKLNEGVGLAATPLDIAENPNELEFIEMEAAAIPSALGDVDFAIINGNYAIGAGLDTSSVLATESTEGDAAELYGNIIAVRAGEEATLKTQALVAALSDPAVAQFIGGTYSGSVVSLGGAAAAIPAAEGDDVVIKVGASPAPHAEILGLVKDALAAAGWTLEVVEFSDYIQPNVALTDGELDANYFQHISYLNDYNAENGTDLVSAGAVHFEPLGMYPGKTAGLEGLATL